MDTSDPPQQLPPRRCRADHKESVRRVILDAARGLFACEGYGSVSLRKIARRIGYTPMAIYVHFRDKSEILDCICEETFAGFRGNSDRLDRLALPPRERLEAGLRFYIEFGLEHPHHYQLTFMTPPCGEQSLGRRKEIGIDCYQRMREKIALCLGETAGTGPSAELTDAAASPETPHTPETSHTSETSHTPEIPHTPQPPEPPETPEITPESAGSVRVEVASQAIWTGVHGLVSLLIARPEFPWVDRQQLIDSVLQNVLRNLEVSP